MITLNTKLDILLFSNIEYVRNIRTSYVLLFTCHVAWSNLTEASLSSLLSSPLQRGVKQKLKPMCVCHIIITRVLY